MQKIFTVKARCINNGFWEYPGYPHKTFAIGCKIVEKEENYTSTDSKVHQWCTNILKQKDVNFYISEIDGGATAFIEYDEGTDYYVEVCGEMVLATEEEWADKTLQF